VKNTVVKKNILLILFFFSAQFLSARAFSVPCAFDEHIRIHHKSADEFEKHVRNPDTQGWKQKMRFLFRAGFQTRFFR